MRRKCSLTWHHHIQIQLGSIQIARRNRCLPIFLWFYRQLILSLTRDFHFSRRRVGPPIQSEESARTRACTLTREPTLTGSLARARPLSPIKPTFDCTVSILRCGHNQQINESCATEKQSMVFRRCCAWISHPVWDACIRALANAR